ncbi:MAG: NUDIX domain-containing protein [Theionarchaea archaeon]|nr:NUDIX domain-containing protein [Theionarchaea archaeon]
MKEESCGAVIYHSDEFLLLHYEAGHWDFPKGNREKGETKLETARREIEEETGLTDLEFTDFEEEISYFYRREGKTIYKTVTYFLARSFSKKITISWEHKGYEWLTYEKALDRITFQNAREILEAAQSYVNIPPKFQQLRL